MSDLDDARTRRALDAIAGGLTPRDTIRTGFPSVDNALGGGFRRGDLVVLGLYRHEMYESAPDVDGATELLVLKNRNGARGYVDLFFYKQWMRFEDMLEPDR